MSYARVPQTFMPDIFLQPHNFSDPQNPQHGQYVNMQLRNDLYFSTLDAISKVQFKVFNVGGEEEWIKVEGMRECRGEEHWWSGYAEEWKKRRGKILREREGMQVELLSCQDWDVAYHYGDRKSSSVYRVKVYQSSTDIFKSQIFPPSWFKSLKDLLLN